MIDIKKWVLARTVKPLVLLCVVTILIGSVCNGQSTSKEASQKDKDYVLASEKISILSDLRNFDEQGLGLSPLSRALVKAEIADAAWLLEREWAQALLSKAYELTLPNEEESDKSPRRIIGSRPKLPSSADRAKRFVRNRVLQIAAREKGFSEQLLRSGQKPLDIYETQMTYASLAETARQDKDLDAAGQYVLKMVEIDPSQITAGSILVKIASTDRVRADSLIVEYFERLSHFQLSRTNDSVFRVFWVVDRLAFPPVGTEPPGPAVMRAYVAYVTHSLGNLEAREPGSLAVYRHFLLRAWGPLKQYAPDLSADFMALEQQSRKIGEAASLSMVDIKSNIDRDTREDRSKDASDSDLANEVTINRAINRSDFTKARRLIEKLPDGLQKAQFTDLTNAKEALFLLKKDEFNRARLLAEKLKQASSIREVYLALIEKCLKDKDQICGTSFMLEAMKQLKASNIEPQILLPDLPSSVASSRREFDPILDGISRLTLAVFPLSEDIAFVGLGETVAAANLSLMDTGQGRIGLDVSIFKKLAPKSEQRARQEAESFKDPFRRLVSLATIYQWKAADLDRRLIAARSEKTKAGAAGNN